MEKVGFLYVRWHQAKNALFESIGKWHADRKSNGCDLLTLLHSWFENYVFEVGASHHATMHEMSLINESQKQDFQAHRMDRIAHQLAKKIIEKELFYLQHDRNSVEDVLTMRVVIFASTIHGTIPGDR